MKFAKGIKLKPSVQARNFSFVAQRPLPSKKLATFGKIWHQKCMNYRQKSYQIVCFKCIFLIILKFSLHFKIISMPIYSELQVKAPDI